MRPNPLVRGLLWVLWMAAGASGVLAAEALASETEPVQVVLPSGVRYVDLKVGTGEEAREGKILEVHYTGWLTDKTRFDSTQDCNEPLTLRLGAGDVIKGLDEGLIGMKVGGKRRLTIPPELGFGKEGGGERIPPDATLIYEVELLAVR
jgi:FKBP-type peptidyl-prolyl cis-trans isomerase FkpA